MATALPDVNTLYYGDNLAIMREHLPDESVDLIYLDPPFNSNASYNVLFKDPTGETSQSQIEAFDDTWHWTHTAEEAYWEVLKGANTDAALVLETFRRMLGENDLMAYLAMMAVRLLELHRVLKSTGSLYLHCDPTASHYLKILLDGIFGKKMFGNELIWQRTNAKGLAFTRFARNHDVIFRYTKTEKWTWNILHTHHDPDYIKKFYRFEDAETGRRYALADLVNPNKKRPNLTYEFLGVTRVWRWTRDRMQKAYDDGLILQSKDGIVPRFKRYLDEQEGNPIGDVWVDIRPVQSHSKEALGYPTQKPVSLLERILAASSNEGDVVLDPFCGCGTTVHAAQKMGRRWLGIDITHIAVSLIERRLRDAFPEIRFSTVGVPQDLAAARDLAARDKHEFEKWAVSLVPDAQPHKGGRKGADTGIDGIVYLRTGKSETTKAIIEIKGGGVSVDQVHKLKSVIEREKALMGIFITLLPPTKPMMAEAASAGFVEVDMGVGSAQFPRIQIITIEELLEGKRLSLPIIDSTAFKKAKREGIIQVELEI
jgi:site-specific DNA-methyltransferase (adenine-specific)